MKISEVIVVEGKNDSNVLKSYIDCDTIETFGSNISTETLAYIQETQKKRGVIIFTDPDAPGERIRTIINQHVKGCKNAFIEKNKAKTTKKVGIEHASKEDILESLAHLMTYRETEETLSYKEFIELGFTGRSNSGSLREAVSSRLHIGRPNAKTLFKRLNMLQMQKEDIEKLMREII